MSGLLIKSLSLDSYSYNLEQIEIGLNNNWQTANVTVKVCIIINNGSICHVILNWKRCGMIANIQTKGIVIRLLCCIG